MGKSRRPTVSNRRSSRGSNRLASARSARQSNQIFPRRRFMSWLSFFGRTPVLAAAGLTVVAGFVIYAVLQAANPAPPGPSKSERAELNAAPDLPGEYIKPHPGPDGQYGTDDDAQHMGVGVSLAVCSADVIEADSELSDVKADRTAVGNCYTSNPPTSGPMSEQTGGFRVYQNPAPKEAFVHTMEHAGVVVWYNTDDEDIKQQLESVVKDQQDRRRLVAMVPYPEMEPDTIAVTAWTRLDKFPVSEFSKKRVEQFIEAHNKRYNPEGF